jgi:hypothetical protein
VVGVGFGGLLGRNWVALARACVQQRLYRRCAKPYPCFCNRHTVGAIYIAMGTLDSF